MVAPQIPTIYSGAGKSLVIDPTVGQETFSGLGDLTSNYNRRISNLFQDDFDTFSQSIYASTYNLAAFHVGGGTNNVTDNISMATLTTGALINNAEGTRSNQAFILRSKLPRVMCKVNLPDVTTINFRLGFYNAAAKYAWIEFDSSLDAHWRVTLNDSTGAEYSAVTGDVVVLGTDYYLELWLASDGTVHWGESATSVITELATTGISKKVTADNYYTLFRVEALAGAAARIAKVDMFETEKLKLG